MSNSLDSGETAHGEPSQLDLRCLQKPIVIADYSGRIKTIQTRKKIKPNWESIEEDKHNPW